MESAFIIICFLNNYLVTEIRTYSSTDDFLSLIPISDWLIFCCGNSILHQKRNENDKNTNFFIKKTKTAKKVYEI